MNPYTELTLKIFVKKFQLLPSAIVQVTRQKEFNPKHIYCPLWNFLGMNLGNKILNSRMLWGIDKNEKQYLFEFGELTNRNKSRILGFAFRFNQQGNITDLVLGLRDSLQLSEKKRKRFLWKLIRKCCNIPERSRRKFLVPSEQSKEIREHLLREGYSETEINILFPIFSGKNEETVQKLLEYFSKGE